MNVFLQAHRALASVLLSTSLLSQSYAVPVTLAFDAEINSVTSSPAFDSGLHIGRGDAIVGTFAFEPTAANGQTSVIVTQPYSASLLIDNKALSSSGDPIGLTLGSINNSFIESDCGKLSCPTLEFDQISVGASLRPVVPVLTPEIGFGDSSFDILLWGNTSLLDSAKLPDSASAWNAFDLTRQLRVILRDNDSGVLTISATLGTFVFVPEPHSTGLIFSALLVSAVSRNWQNGDSHLTKKHFSIFFRISLT